MELSESSCNPGNIRVFLRVPDHYLLFDRWNCRAIAAETCRHVWSVTTKTENPFSCGGLIATCAISGFCVDVTEIRNPLGKSANSDSESSGKLTQHPAALVGGYFEVRLPRELAELRFVAPDYALQEDPIGREAALLLGDVVALLQQVQPEQVLAQPVGKNKKSYSLPSFVGTENWRAFSLK